MSMNEMMNEKKAMFTVRNILRSLAMFCIIVYGVLFRTEHGCQCDDHS